MSQTELQVALAAYLDASIPIIMTRFDFSAAVEKMIAFQYGWVGGMIASELRAHVSQHNMNNVASFKCSPQLEADLSVTARTIARDLLILVRNRAVREIITPNWSGYSFWSGGFSARVTPDGVMSLELQLQWTTTAGPALTELRKRFKYLRAQSYAAASHAAAVPVDFVSTKRRFLPLNDHE